jgi:hypothetical protein
VDVQRLPVDELSVGSDRSRRWPVMALVVVLVLAAAVAVLDQRRREAELAALLGAARGAQQVLASFDLETSQMVTYGPPSLGERFPPGDRRDIDRLVRGAARAHIGELRAARDRVARTPLSRWHPELHRARDTYLAYVDERLAGVAQVGLDADALFAAGDVVRSRLAEARAAMEAAAGVTGERRVDAVFRR